MISLSTADLGRLAAAQQTLLSPLAHATIMDWRRESQRQLKELVNADYAASILPLPGIPLAYSEEIGPSEIRQYVGRLQPLTGRLVAWQKAGSLGVFTRDMLCAVNLDEYHESEDYNEYLRATIRGADAIGVSTLLRTDADPAVAPQVILARDRPDAPRFADRELALLRLVQPAYAAGVEACVRFTEHRAALARALDTLSEGLLVCDRRGAVIHANAALETLLAAEPERERLHGEVRRIADALATGASPARPLLGPAQCTVAAAGATYGIRGNYMAENAFHAEMSILITVERTTSVIPAAEDIRARFTLTGKETAVARLLAEGKANNAVAAALHISPHTARRHTESVMKKLGVRSRAEVGPVLLRRDLS